MVTQHCAITDEHIIPTKLYITPQRPLLVSRPRLLKHLNRRSLGKLTIVVAPAGSGKTTLLTSWLTHLPFPWDTRTISNQRSISWFSIDINDNYLARFRQWMLPFIDGRWLGLAERIAVGRICGSDVLGE